MASKKAGFITGANAKIAIDKKTIAYATNVGYDITVQTIPIEGIGRYEVWSNEPVSYTCSGSLSIIRYTARASASGIPHAEASGNGLGTIPTGGSAANAQFSPGAMLASETFDLTVYEKTAPGPANEDGSAAAIVENAVVVIKDCRFTRRSGNLDKRGVLMDQYTFVGVLAGDATGSGLGIDASATVED